jgi:hypothetical protein
MDEDNNKRADSYVRVIRLDDQWAVRYAVLVESENGNIMQPLEWFGEDLSHGIELVEQAAWGLIENDMSISDRASFPMLDKLSHEVLVRQCNKLKVGWAIQVFRSPQYPAWFALAGHDGMLEKGTLFSRAAGNDDMAIAIGELKVERACEAVEYHKSMKEHYIIPRDENGDYVKYTAAQRIKRSPVEKARYHRARGNFKEWDGWQRWQKEIKSFKGTRKRKSDRVD